MKKEEKHSTKCPICGRPTHKESKYCIFHASAEEKTIEEFKQALREYVIKETCEFNFEEFIFVGYIDFKEDLNFSIVETNFGAVTFEGNANFKGVIFKGFTNFTRATFKKDANFRDVIFEGWTHFGSAIFEGNAEFNEATFQRDVLFDDVTFKEYVDFRNVTFKLCADFRNVTFKGNTTFRKARFLEETKFGRSIFEGNAEFKEAIFEGNAEFNEATFQRRAYFRNVTFKGNINFGNVTFKLYANFQNVTFKGNTTFRKANFPGFINFGSAIFEGNAEFNEATLYGYAYFIEVIFKGNVGFVDVTSKLNTLLNTVFQGVTFKENTALRGVSSDEYEEYDDDRIFERDDDTTPGDTIFEKDDESEKGTIEDDADYRLKYFAKILNFSNSKIFSGKKLFIRLKNGIGKISFKNTYLENVHLNIELNKGMVIDFTGALIKNTKIQKGQMEDHILQEKKKNYLEAKEIYLLLKNNFHSIGRYDDESWAFKKEKDMDRLSHSYPSFIKELKSKDKKEKLPLLKWIQKGNFKKWITSAFSNMIYGYGENPWNVARSAVVIIVLFALSFSLIGIGGNPEMIELHGKIHPIPGTDMRMVSEGVLQSSKIMQFSDCLYFSLITFTTLGYGDFRPLEGWGRILAGSEAFIGAFMMALFVYTFARRTGGR